MIHTWNELTESEPIIQTRSVESPQHYFISGWMEMSSHIKQHITELREKTNERDTIAKLDELYEFCKSLEKSSFHHMPTVIAHKK